VITVSVDSTFIRSREGERHLEVHVGNVETAAEVGRYSEQ
jgi:hypothetical protein